MSMLKELFVNIPLVKALEQVPSYAKFMKKLVTKKGRVSCDPADNMHYYNAIASWSLVEKRGDPRAFTILCPIGSFNFARALCDLGDNINLMSLFVYKQLGLGYP